MQPEGGQPPEMTKTPEKALRPAVPARPPCRGERGGLAARAPGGTRASTEVRLALQPQWTLSSLYPNVKDVTGPHATGHAGQRQRAWRCPLPRGTFASRRKHLKVKTKTAEEGVHSTPASCPAWTAGTTVTRRGVRGLEAPCTSPSQMSPKATVTPGPTVTMSSALCN